MATFTVKIDTENAAFDDGNRDAEISRILSGIAGAIGAGGIAQGMSQTIRDINGHDVGRWKLHNDHISVKLTESQKA